MTPFFESAIFDIYTEKQFSDLSLEIFRYQAAENPVYAEYLDHLKIKPQHIQHVHNIPFLPIEFFKTHTVISGIQGYDSIFTSSGTTGMQTSKHYVSDIGVYIQSFENSFRHFYGESSEYTVLALLPSYLEREGSSLIYMAEYFIQKSNDNRSGFYLNNYDDLIKMLLDLKKENKKVLLLGVTFALLELAENHTLDLGNTIVMETGGMKGRREELTRNELHRILTEKLGVSHIHSEYGMTELLSQAYSKGSGFFYTPPWMRVMIRDIYDPFTYLESKKNGAINIIDLANFNSCSFIETKDLGRQFNDGSFEILGRFDNSDIRGCNLLVTQ